MSRWLISVAELEASYRRDDVVVIDCRFALADPTAGERQFAAAHISGSRYAHLDRDLSAARSQYGGRHPLPSVAALTETFSTLGINSAPPSLVVAYDDSRFAFAARLWWLLRYCGHDNVKVLDGGYRAWCAAQLPVDDAPPHHKKGVFVPKVRKRMAVDIDAVKNIETQNDTVLIDARETPRFLGIEEAIDPVAGHIDGALNFPWQQVSDERGFFRSVDEQRAHWGAIAAQENIVMYCGSGVTACVNLLSLAEIDRDDAQLYAGSWSDWCAHL